MPSLSLLPASGCPSWSRFGRAACIPITREYPGAREFVFHDGHKMLLVQWQDGERAIVWPEELAPGQPRFPTPPWNQRL